MGSDILKKFVFEDNGTTKVIKGYINVEEEFVYKITAYKTNINIVLGKRSIVKISNVEGDDNY